MNAQEEQMSFDKRTQGMSERKVYQDKRSGFSIGRLMDPFFWVALSFSYFLLGKKYKLNQTESLFILDNVAKHRLVLWVNLLGGSLVYHSLVGSTPEQLSALINVLLAPAFITGGAWFAITFGGVPEKLLDAALIITFWMLSAFSLSLTTMGVAVYFSLNGSWMLLSVILFINLSVILSAIMYDNIDGLKVGLDEALKSNSQANLRYLKKFHDVEPPAEGHSLYEGLDDSTSDNPQESAHEKKQLEDI